MSDLDSLALTPRLLVALDFDGTLSPLVDEPMSARMIPAARRALDALTALPATDALLPPPARCHHRCRAAVTAATAAG